MFDDFLTVNKDGLLNLPAELQKELGLVSGMKYRVTSLGNGGFLVTLPTTEDFNRAVDRLTQVASDLGIEPGDIEELVQDARRADQ